MWWPFFSKRVCVDGANKPPLNERDAAIKLLSDRIGFMSIQGNEFPDFLAERFVDMERRISELERKLEEK